MHTTLMKNVVFANPNKDGELVQIKVINGLLAGKEFQAKKTQETASGQVINCFHFTNEGVKTYLQEKDVVIL